MVTNPFSIFARMLKRMEGLFYLHVSVMACSVKKYSAGVSSETV